MGDNLRKGLLLTSAIAVIAIMTAPAAMAADDHEGFYVLADAAMATPGNTNTAILSSGLEDGGQTGSFEQETAWMDWDDDFTWTLGFGYSFGEQGRIQVSYWNYSGDADMDGSGKGNNAYNWFNIGPTASVGYSFYNSPMDFDFTQEIDATALDVDFLRTTHLNSPVTVDWGVGIRILSFEDNVEGEYVDSSSNRFPASRNIQSDGFGFSGTLGVGYDFNDRFGLSTGMKVGFVVSDVDAEAEITDQDGYYHTAGFTHKASADGIEDEVAFTMDFNANLTIQIVDAFHIDVGWFFTQWTDMPENQLGREVFGTDDQAGVRLNGEGRDRITWSGPRIAGVWKFGKGM